jgi:hypothetical protein
MNLLHLKWVQNPDSLVEEALYHKQGENLVSLAYTGWTTFFKTPEREAAAQKLLGSLEKRGLKDWKKLCFKQAEKAAKELKKMKERGEEIPMPHQ